MHYYIIHVNDIEYRFKSKLTVLQACYINNVDVPRFCYYEQLSIAGNCRMCLVEDLKQLKPLASCAVNIVDKLAIYTETIKVRKAREYVLEFLLANHPLDCPICDQGGECDLQDQSLIFGGDRGRFYEYKRSVEDKNCGPLVKTIMNRCIHRTRCVRFSTEIGGVNFFGITGRGSKMEIGFYINHLLVSEVSGNIIDLCPVGALTSKPYAFTARPWEVKSYNVIDILDSYHSNIRIDVRGTRILRILPRINSGLNEDWITDRTRFSYDALKVQRLRNPMIRFKGGMYVKTSWIKVFVVIKNILFKLLKNIVNLKKKFLQITCMLGPFLDVESLLMLKMFMPKLGTSSFISRSLVINQDFIEHYSFNTKLNYLSFVDFCLLVGVNLRVELPLLNIRIRKAVVRHHLNVYLIGFFSNFNYYIKHLGCNFYLFLNILEGIHWICNKLHKEFSMKPLVLFNPVIYNFFFNSTYFLYSNLITNTWCGFSIIQTESSSYSLNHLGLHKKNSNIDSVYNYWYYLLGVDNFFLKHSLNNLVIYQGHFGDLGIRYANIVLPSSLFVEKQGSYFNFEGLFQQTKRIFFKSLLVKDDWQIINALQLMLNCNIQIVSYQALFFKLNNYITFFMKNNFRFINMSWKSVYFNLPIVSIINNQYLLNSIIKFSRLQTVAKQYFEGFFNKNFII